MPSYAFVWIIYTVAWYSDNEYQSFGVVDAFYERTCKITWDCEVILDSLLVDMNLIAYNKYHCFTVDASLASLIGNWLQMHH